MSASKGTVFECDAIDGAERSSGGDGKCLHQVVSTKSDTDDARMEISSRGWTYSSTADEDYCPVHSLGGQS